MTEATPEYRIATLSLRPGDTLVAKVTGVLSVDRAEMIGNLIRRQVAPDTSILILDDRVDLQVISTAHSRALIDVIAERRRQVEGEGWTPEHDDENHDHGALAAAGSCYALAAADLINPYSQGDDVDTERPPHAWPFEPEAWKLNRHDPRRALVKAAALILAEIERLDRNPLPEAGA